MVKVNVKYLGKLNEIIEVEELTPEAVKKEMSKNHDDIDILEFKKVSD